MMAVALGGALGSVIRYMIAQHLRTDFPWATLVVNAVGSFLLGYLASSALLGSSSKETLRLFVTVGFCGGFTTFSTFSLQSLQLLQRGEHLQAASNILLNLVLCVSFTFVGYLLSKPSLP